MKREVLKDKLCRSGGVHDEGMIHLLCFKSRLGVGVQERGREGVCVVPV